ncbi:MAG: thioredoxin domain-containing protein [Myxococcales bacterium]|nr:thioredoxin domain-containing protein [Myxococcales bacterium]
MHVKNRGSLTAGSGLTLRWLARGLVYGVWATWAFACTKQAPDVRPAQAADEGIARAHAATEKSTPAEKSAGAAEAPPPGVDLASLDDFERKVFFRIVGKEPSACGKGHSLIESVRTDPGCRKSFYATRYVARLVEAGFTDSEITQALEKRYRKPEVVKVDTTGAPAKGATNARVTIVEFVDFECPHCKRIQPVLRQIVDEFPADVRVVMKHYPLGQHTNARLAASASVAAHLQGKFWPYSEKVWENSDFLTPALLETLAKDVGLDVARWRKDFESAETMKKVEADKAQGAGYGLRSTPTLYVNGKLFTDSRDIESLRDWVTEELGR